MQSSDNNPYAPSPASDVCDRDASWYVKQVQLYYKWMGILILVYTAMICTVTVAQELAETTMKVSRVVAPFVMCGLAAVLATMMLRIAFLPIDKLDSHYKAARWLGILAGAVFFPILSIPAFVAVRRLSIYKRLAN